MKNGNRTCCWIKHNIIFFIVLNIRHMQTIIFTNYSNTCNAEYTVLFIRTNDECRLLYLLYFECNKLCFCIVAMCVTPRSLSFREWSICIRYSTGNKYSKMVAWFGWNAVLVGMFLTLDLCVSKSTAHISIDTDDKNGI